MKHTLTESAMPPASEELEDEGPQVGLLDLLTWVGEGKRLVAMVTVTAALASVVLTLLMPTTYTARTTLLPPGAQQQSSSAAALAQLGALGGLAGGWPRRHRTSCTSRCSRAIPCKEL